MGSFCGVVLFRLQVAFTIGERYEPGNGFTVMAAHTDSPCLKIKPRAGAMKSELLTLGTEFYGGGIWCVLGSIARKFWLFLLCLIC